MARRSRSTDHAAEFARGWEDGEQAFDLSMSPGAPEILTRAQLRRSHSEAYSKGYLAAVHEGEGDLDEYIELEGSEPSPNPRKSQWYEVLWDDGEERYRETLTAPSFRAAVTESQSLIRRIAGTPGGTLLLAQEMDDGAMMFEVSGVPGVYAALVSKIRTPTLKPEGRRGAAPAWLRKMKAKEQERKSLLTDMNLLRQPRRKNPRRKKSGYVAAKIRQNTARRNRGS